MNEATFAVVPVSRALMSLMPSRGLLALNSSAEFREKALKLVQFVAKFLAAFSHNATLKSLAKSVSSARRLITFLRWVKYFDDFVAARGMRSTPLRGLQYAEASLNLTIDMMADVITLDKLGLLLGARLPKLGRWTFEEVVNKLDVLLATVGIAASVINLRTALATLRYSEEQIEPAADTKAAPKAASGLSKQKIALLKYVSDFIKAVDAAGMHGHLAPGERLGALGGIVGAFISAGKLRDTLQAKALRHAA